MPLLPQLKCVAGLAVEADRCIYICLISLAFLFAVIIILLSLGFILPVRLLSSFVANDSNAEEKQRSASSATPADPGQ
jgi:hypothetical protein